MLVSNMLHIFGYFILYVTLNFNYIKCEIPMLKVKQLDENIVNRKRLDTLEMCRIFNDGMKYSESTKKYPNRYKRGAERFEDIYLHENDDYFNNNNNEFGPSVILNNQIKIGGSIENPLSQELTKDKQSCHNFTHCYSVKNYPPGPSEISDQVGMTTDFAPKEIEGPDPVEPIQNDDDGEKLIPWHKRWKLGIVPFFIDPKTYDTHLGEIIIRAFDYFEKVTCIRLQKLRERPTDKESLQRVEWLYITNPTGIRQCVHTNDQKANNGVQMVVFGYDCMSLGEIVHEIMHVLGFSHEHVRPNRDNFVEILWNNIKPGYKKYFVTRSEDMLSHLPYDYSSVMHYPSRAFSRNGQHTIIAKSILKIGQREGLSETDTIKVNYVYAAECLQRNRQYLENTCPVVIESDTKVKPKVVDPSDIEEYFKNRLWHFGVVNYKFKDIIEFSIEERDNIAAVIRHIEKETCVRFLDAGDKKETEENKNDPQKQDYDDQSSNSEGGNDSTYLKLQNSDINTAPEQYSQEESTTTQISRQGAIQKLQSVTRHYVNGGRPLVLSSIEYSDRNLVQPYVILSDPSDYSYYESTKDKKSVSKKSGRRHAHSMLILSRSNKPGCKCPTPGRPDGDKILSISVECFNSVNDLLHLFVHVLGLDHQHNMHDRDSYLHIVWDKLSEENREELKNILPPEASLGYPYDYQSVMHYPWLEIKNGESNIMYPIWNDGWAMGHWQGLSSTDVKKLNALYFDKCALRKKEMRKI